mmetsp:Transcript_65325/g.181657  ORF Transcript_65325/g.181657 Transcript_65325/m.181657 type:complete len:222 (-) Transcript_65325:1263-1928(-)
MCRLFSGMRRRMPRVVLVLSPPASSGSSPPSSGAGPGRVAAAGGACGLGAPRLESSVGGRLRPGAASGRSHAGWRRADTGQRPMRLRSWRRKRSRRRRHKSRRSKRRPTSANKSSTSWNLPVSGVASSKRSSWALVSFGASRRSSDLSSPQRRALPPRRKAMSSQLARRSSMSPAGRLKPKARPSSLIPSNGRGLLPAWRRRRTRRPPRFGARWRRSSSGR